MKKPLISVILPIYNVEMYIEECLNSLVNQTIGVENLEVIMVNDCSTDSTKSIMDKYSEKYSNFISIHLEKNTGSPSTPKNIGVEQATGEYLIFLDPDDYVPKDAYEKLYKYAQKYKSDFVMGSLVRFNSQKQWKQPQLNTAMLQRYHRNIKIEEKPEFLSVLGYLVNKLIKTSFFKKYKIQFNPSIKLGEDFIICNQLMLLAKRFSYIPENVYFYRMRDEEEENSLTQLEPYEAISNFVIADNIIFSNFCDLKKLDLYKNSNLQTVQSIIYRLNDEFLTLSIKEQREILNLARPTVLRFDDEFLEKLIEFDRGLIKFLKEGNVESIILYIELKVKRNEAFQAQRELQIASKELNRIYKSKYWKMTKPFRKVRAKLTLKVKKLVPVSK
ncbi:TPA: glycosyltransferase family 2 protein [Bacillus tropicus]|nr:glycosyltransferase family 2 protein [Bacillus tropicus]